MTIISDVKAMIRVLKRDRTFDPYEIWLPAERVAHTTILEDGLEFWDFSSDEFLLEAWDVMTFGGVHVRT